MRVKCRRFKWWKGKREAVEFLAFIWIETVLLEMLQGKGDRGFVGWGDLDISKQLTIETS